jgi:hypothetical protein
MGSAGSERLPGGERRPERPILMAGGFALFTGRGRVSICRRARHDNRHSILGTGATS